MEKKVIAEYGPRILPGKYVVDLIGATEIPMYVGDELTYADGKTVRIDGISTIRCRNPQACSVLLSGDIDTTQTELFYEV